VRSTPPLATSSVAPLVTVGIPVRNGERYLEEAIASVLRQDHPALEVVISDNASTDRTPDIARRHAERDPRVRYHRNPEDVGVVANFEITAALATGKYFTWLPHDDVLSPERSISTIVAFLEEHESVVLCGSSVRVHPEEDPGGGHDRTLDALWPQGDWSTARLEFFRWPQSVHHFVIYGVYRRVALLAVPMGARRYRGRHVVTDMEFPLLAGLCGHGRIVALPEVLRSFRSRADSAGASQVDTFSAVDHLVLAHWMKIRLLRIAWGLALPLPERVSLVKTTLGNFLRAPMGRRPEFSKALGRLRREVGVLRAACDERLAIIREMERAAEDRDALIASLREELAEARRATPLDGGSS